jgi:hypothetical protein
MHFIRGYTYLGRDVSLQRLSSWEVFMAVKIKIMIFKVMTLYSFTGGYLDKI